VTLKQTEVIGVVKAYTTRVGAGPFPSEQLNDTGAQLQSIGKEVGVTTGRKRRTGHLDLVLTRYTHDVNGYTALNLTKLDILDSFDEIPIAIGYSVDGQQLESFPASLALLDQVKVEYKVLPGWKSSTSGLKKWEDLPEKAKEYVKFIEDFVGVKIKYIGTGPGREDMIYREGAVAPA
jgi:adenylosuccinate synthase